MRLPIAFDEIDLDFGMFLLFVRQAPCLALFEIDFFSLNFDWQAARNLSTM